MNRYKQFAVAGVALSIVGILAGCGTGSTTAGSSPRTNTTNHAVSNITTQSNTSTTTTNTKTGAAPAYIFEISWHGERYFFSKNILKTKIGNQVGDVEEKVKKDHVLKVNKTISNFATTGSKVFSISGIETSKAIAIEYPAGTYWEAVAYKSQ